MFVQLVQLPRRVMLIELLTLRVKQNLKIRSLAISAVVIIKVAEPNTNRNFCGPMYKYMAVCLRI